MCGVKGRWVIVLFKQHSIRRVTKVFMITNLQTKRISALSQWKTFMTAALPTRWRRKTAGIEITSLSPYVFRKRNVVCVYVETRKRLSYASQDSVPCRGPLAQRLGCPIQAFFFFFRTDCDSSTGTPHRLHLVKKSVPQFPIWFVRFPCCPIRILFSFCPFPKMSGSLLLELELYTREREWVRGFV